MITNQNYCSQKFWWLSVYPERKLLSSCCASSSEIIDTTWLKNNPGRLFNTPKLQEERQQMLAGQRVKSCESTCWQVEDRGLISRRLAMNSKTQTHINLESDPTVLNIVLGSNCNLTCVYCCKQYSTAWFQDIKNNGPYFDNDEKFEINHVDLAVENLGQKNIANSDFFQQILHECKQFKNLNRIEITGGEPFLYNALPDLVNSLDGKIFVVTGLGVENRRFERILDKITSDFILDISAETTDKFYEFVRFGNTFDRFQKNMQSIRDRQIPYRFSSTLSNLTIFDFQNFQRKFSDQTIEIQLCNDPDYLSLNVLDDVSKEIFLQTDFGTHTDLIHNLIKVETTQNQKEKFSSFINSFVNRRNISLDIYPPHFQFWIRS
jgi:organic radical activating enzyme